MHRGSANMSVLHFNHRKKIFGSEKVLVNMKPCGRSIPGSSSVLSRASLCSEAPREDLKNDNEVIFSDIHSLLFNV